MSMLALNKRLFDIEFNNKKNNWKGVLYVNVSQDAIEEFNKNGATHNFHCAKIYRVVGYYMTATANKYFGPIIPYPHGLILEVDGRHDTLHIDWVGKMYKLKSNIKKDLLELTDY